MAKSKIKNHQTKSIISSAIEKSQSQTISHLDNDCFVVSLKHIDKTQGQNFEVWEAEKILSRSLEVLAGYCTDAIRRSVGPKFTIYGGFPPKHKTEFSHPLHVPEDAEWARIHVTGKQCIIGHIVKNTFYIVFLDRDHKFWISTKKHT
jgi:hypothetical protein